MDKTIEIDCAPGGIRPDGLLPQVLAGTGIEPVEATNMFFGNWTFDFSHISDELWESTKAIRKERITKLYNDGTIRYGSW